MSKMRHEVHCLPKERTKMHQLILFKPLEPSKTSDGGHVYLYQGASLGLDVSHQSQGH